jgi:hypothetical protein
MDDDEKREVIHQLANPHLQEQKRSISVEKKEIIVVNGLEPPDSDELIDSAIKAGLIDSPRIMEAFEDDRERGTLTGLYQSASTTEVKASRWQIFKQRLGDWWERARVRLCCWILRIDEFRIKVKADKLRGWKPNFPRNHLVLEEGMITMEDEDDFRHMRGKVTLKDGSNMTVSAPPEPVEWSPDSPVAFYDVVTGTPSAPGSTLRANSAGYINTPPPKTLKGMLKNANGCLWMGNPKWAHYYVDMALRHMRDAWDVEAYCCAHCPMSSPENDPCQWKPPAEEPGRLTLEDLMEGWPSPDEAEESDKRPLVVKILRPTNPPKFPEELPPSDETLAKPKVTPEDIDEENEGPCAHPDNKSGECNLECNYFDEETDRLDDGECKWHHEPEKSYPEGSCYRNLHPDVDADDVEVYQCGGEACSYSEMDPCSYLKPPEDRPTMVFECGKCGLKYDIQQGQMEKCPDCGHPPLAAGE